MFKKNFFMWVLLPKFQTFKNSDFCFLTEKMRVDNILEKKCCPVHLAEGPLKIDPLHIDSLICLVVARTIHPKSGWPLWHPDY